MIATDVLEPDYEAEDGSIDDNGADWYGEDDSGLGEVGVSTGVSEVGTKKVEEVQQAVKYSSLFPIC